MLLKVSTCLLAFGLTAASAQAQDIPTAFHGIWAAQVCDSPDLEIRISGREMRTNQSVCAIKPGTLKVRSSGISFQSGCSEGRDPVVRDAFIVLEFEAGYGRNVLIGTTFIKGIDERKDVRPFSLGRCIPDAATDSNRFATGDEPPTHGRAYEPARAARLISGEPSIDMRPRRQAGSCTAEFCETHNEAERCYVEAGKPMCTAIYSQNKGTSLFRAFVDTRTGAVEKTNCVANCFGKDKRRMTPSDIDSDFSESDAVEEEE